MSKFRKKSVVIEAFEMKREPVVIEAFQMTRERRRDNVEWPEWMNRAWNGVRDEVGTVQTVEMTPSGEQLEVVMLNGHATVYFGDWILCSVNGELYSCRPDVFERLYEPVTE